MAKAQKSRSKSRTKQNHRAKLKSQDCTLGLQVVHPQAAGIDIGNEEHWVAVPPDLDPEPAQSFGCFTKDLHEMADWLVRCGIQTVAMQSTGVYWIALYDILSERGIRVFVVNAQDTNGGQKSGRELAAGTAVATRAGRIFQTKIAECDRQLHQHYASMQAKADPQQLAPVERDKRAHGNVPDGFDLREELYRVTGVDLTGIDGVNVLTAQTLLSEVGSDMSRFATEAHFVSYLNLSPNNKDQWRQDSGPGET